MKNWENAELVEVSIYETANGGNPDNEFDQLWNDDNNALHANFKS